MTDPIIRPATLHDLPGVLTLYCHLHPDDPALDLTTAGPAWAKPGATREISHRLHTEFIGYPTKATTLWSVTLATAALVPALPWLLSGVAWGQATAWAWGGVIYLALGVTIVGYGL